MKKRWVEVYFFKKSWALPLHIEWADSFIGIHVLCVWIEFYI